MSQKNANRLLGRETADANGIRMSGPLNPGAAGIVLLLACPPGVAGDPDGAAGPHGGAGRLDVAVVEVVERYPPYADFCGRHPAECDLGGPVVVASSPALMQTLGAVSAAVNREITFALDASQYDAEEYWALPTSGYGDCEDRALEKRRRLARLGLPRGAMRIALVFHRDLLTAHGVLTVETTAGTYILDSATDAVLRWDQAPYNFEARERLDGRWERFDQSQWTHHR